MAALTRSQIFLEREQLVERSLETSPQTGRRLVHAHFRHALARSDPAEVSLLVRLDAPAVLGIHVLFDGFRHLIGQRGTLDEQSGLGR